MSEQKQAGWRGDKNSGGSRGRSWQSKEKKTSIKASVFHHRIKVGACMLAVLILTGIVLYVVFRDHKRLTVIAVGVSRYDDRIPPNGFVQEDFAEFGRINSKNLNFVTANKPTAPLNSDQVWTEIAAQLDKKPPGGPSGKATVIYLSAHGALNDAGKACLLFFDADPWNTSNWLPLDELFARFKSHKGMAKRNILIILDANRIVDEWSMGILHNGFSDAIQTAINEAEVPNLYVLNSTSANEGGWSLPEIGGSAFGRMVAQGLQGDANNNEDRVVTLQELADYVKKKTARLVSMHRGSIQTPRLFLPPDAKPDADFDLIYGAEPYQSAGKVSLDALQAKWQALKKGWQNYAEVTANGDGERFDPIGMAALRYKLTQCRRMMFAGAAYEEETNSKLEELTSRTSMQAMLWSPDELLRPNLANTGPLSDEEKQLAKLLRDNALEDVRKLLAKSPTVNYLSLARVVVSVAGKNPAITQEQMSAYVEFLKLKPGVTVEPVPTHLLRLFQRDLDWKGKAPLAQASALAFQTRSLAQRAARSNDDPRLHYWVRAATEAGDRERRRNEDRLFNGGLERVRAAAKDLQTLVADTRQSPYLKGLALADTLSKRYQLCDRAWSHATHIGRWLSRQRVQGSRMTGTELGQLAGDLNNLIKNNLILGQELAKASLTLDGQPSEKMDNAIQQVQSAFRHLETQIGIHTNTLLGAGSDGDVIREIENIIDLPSLPYVERGRLGDNLLSAMQNLVGGDSKEKKLEQQLESAKVNLSILIGPDKEHWALAILADRQSQLLSSDDRRDNNWEMLKNAEPDQAAYREALHKQGVEVRHQLSKMVKIWKILEKESRTRLAAVGEPRAMRAGLAEADRLARAAATLLRGRQKEFVDPDTGNLDDITRELLKVDTHFFLLWQARRALDDCYGNLRFGQDPYFVLATNQYKNDALRLCDPQKLPSINGKSLNALILQRWNALKRIEVLPNEVVRYGKAKAIAQKIVLKVPAGLPDEGRASVFLRQNDELGKTVAVEFDDGKQVRRTLKPTADKSTGDLQHFVPTAQLMGPDGKTVIQLLVTWMWRGNLVSEPCPVRSARAVLTSVVERKYVPPQVIVRGTGKEGRVLFIFDCSATMQGKRVGAKNAMKAVLKILGVANKFRVGLRAYGHRARFRGGIQRRPGAPVNVDPDADTELLVSMSKLRRRRDDKQTIKAFEERIEKLEPWGQTPLYMSLVKALQNDGFDQAGANEVLRIVLITDGLNAVTGKNKLREYSHRDVVKAQNDLQRKIGRKVPIDIIGVGIRTKNRAERTEFANLKALGNYYPLANVGSLVNQIRKIMALPEYLVKSKEESPDKAPWTQTRELGGDVELKTTPGRRHRKFDVSLLIPDSLAKATFRADGGEQFELEYSNESLTFRPYQPLEHSSDDDSFDDDFRGIPKRQEVQIRDPYDKQPYTYVVRGLKPRHYRDGRIAFFLCLENAKRTRFTVRPSHVWAEIQPVDRDGEAQGEPMHFSDLDFVNKRPVPVLRFLADGWNPAHRWARITMHMKMGEGEVTPTKVSPFEAGDFRVNTTDFKVRGGLIPGAGTTWKLTVEERRGNKSELYRISTQPAARSVQHTRNVGLPITEHVFVFPSRPRALNIQVTSREAIQKGGVRLEEGIVVGTRQEDVRPVVPIR